MSSPFSAKSGRLAAYWGIGNLQNAQAQGEAALDTGRDAAASYLLGGGNSAAVTLQNGLNAQKNYLTDYGNQAIGKLGEAGDQYGGMISAGGAGLGRYLDLVGLGSNGNAGMTDALRSTPGYDFARTEGLDAINRGAAARGMLGSGNTSVDAARYATGFADQTYGSALQRLQPLLSMYGQGTTGKANALGGQAQLLSGMGTSLAGAEKDYATGMGSLFGKVGDYNFNTGAGKANLAQSIGQATTQLGMSGMMAGQQASANQWNAIGGGLQGLGSLFSGAGGFSGLSNGVSGLAKLFG